MATSQTYAPAELRSQRRRAVLASTVGTTIEWYDFFLYGTAAALIFPKIFFPGSTPYAGVLAAFATQFVGFAARPIGAAIFGHFGDKVGRKTTLVTTLMLMGVATFLIGVLPGYAAIGLAAPLLLTLLRIVQGIGVGGEWGGSVLMSMEWGDQKRKGLMASWPQLGVPMGLLLSTGMVKLMSSVAGDGFETWGLARPVPRQHRAGRHRPVCAAEGAGEPGVPRDQEHPVCRQAACLGGDPPSPARDPHLGVRAHV